MATFLFENQDDEDNHLSKEHGLTKTVAYIQSDLSKKQRSTGAERVAKHRQQKKQKGLTDSGKSCIAASSLILRQ